MFNWLEIVSSTTRFEASIATLWNCRLHRVPLDRSTANSTCHVLFAIRCRIDEEKGGGTLIGVGKSEFARWLQH